MPPLNDNFADAIEITGSSGTVTGDNTGATTEVGEPHQPDAGKSIWYKWTPVDGAFTTMDTLATTGVVDDTTLGVYTGASVDALTQIAYNDDTGERLSQVSFTAVAGTQYFIQVAAWSGAQEGDIVLSWLQNILPSLPAGSIPLGSVVVCNNYIDGSRGFLTYLNRTTGALLSVAFLEIDSGGPVDITERGVFATFGPATFDVYREPNLRVATDVVPAPDGKLNHLRCDPRDVFYLPVRKTIDAINNITSVITAVGCNGVPTGAEWQLPAYIAPVVMAPGESITGIEASKISLSPDSTILYVSGNTSHHATTNYGVWMVLRYDLVNEVWLTPLCTLDAPVPPDTYGSLIQDLLTLPSGDILVADSWYGGSGERPGDPTYLPREALLVKRFNPDGTLAQTYPIDDTVIIYPATGGQLDFASDPGGTSFWVKFAKQTSTGTRTFRRIDVVTGDTLNEFDINQGDTREDITKIPDNPFFIHRATVGRCGPRPQFNPQIF